MFIQKTQAGYNLQHIINSIISYGVNQEYNIFGQRLEGFVDKSTRELEQALKNLKEKNLLEAEKCASRSIFYNSESMRSYYTRMFLRICLEKYQEALDDIDQIFKMDFDHSEAKNQYSRVCVLLENQKKFNTAPPIESQHFDSNNKLLQQFKQLLTDARNSEEEEYHLINFYKNNSYFINNSLLKLNSNIINSNNNNNNQNNNNQNNNNQNNNNQNNNNNNIPIAREDDKNEGLFWKVFGNKHLRDMIVDRIKDIVYEKSISEYKFGYRKKFSTITSVRFMAEKRLFSLLKCKLKAGEKLDYGNKDDMNVWIELVCDKETLVLLLRNVKLKKINFFGRAIKYLNYSLLDAILDDPSYALTRDDIFELFAEPCISKLEFVVKKFENRFDSTSINSDRSSVVISQPSIKNELLHFLLINPKDKDISQVLDFIIKYKHYFIEPKFKIRLEYEKFINIHDEVVKKKVLDLNIVDLIGISFVYPPTPTDLSTIILQASNNIRIVSKFCLKESSEWVESKLASQVKSNEADSETLKGLIVLLMQLSKPVKDNLYIHGLCNYVADYFKQFGEFIWDPVLFTIYNFGESDLFSHYNPGILNRLLERKASHNGGGFFGTSLFSSEKPIDSLAAIDFYMIVFKNLKRFLKLPNNCTQFYDNIYKRSTLECFKTITSGCSTDQIENFLHYRDSFDYQKEKFIVDLILERKPSYFIKNTKEYNYSLVIGDTGSIDLLLKFKHYYLNIERYHLLQFSSLELIHYFCEKHEVAINPTPFFMVYYKIDIGRLAFKELMFNCKIKYPALVSVDNDSIGSGSSSSNNNNRLINDKITIDTFSSYLYSTNYRFLNEYEYYGLLKFLTYNSSAKISYTRFPVQSVNYFFEVFTSMNLIKLKQMFDQFSLNYDLYERLIEKSKFKFNREYDLNRFVFKGISCAVPIQILYHFISKPREFNCYFGSMLNMVFRILLQTSDITISRLSEICFLLERYSCNQGSLNGFIFTFFILHIKSPRLSKYILSKMNFFQVTQQFYTYITDVFRCLDIPLFGGGASGFISFFSLYINDNYYPIKDIEESSVQQLFYALHNSLSIRHIEDYHLNKTEADQIHLCDLEYLVDVHDVEALKTIITRYKLMDLVVQNKSLFAKIKQIMPPDALKYQDEPLNLF